MIVTYDVRQPGERDWTPGTGMDARSPAGMIWQMHGGAPDGLARTVPSTVPSTIAPGYRTVNSDDDGGHVLYAYDDYYHPNGTLLSKTAYGMPT